MFELQSDINLQQYYLSSLITPLPLNCRNYILHTQIPNVAPHRTNLVKESTLLKLLLYLPGLSCILTTVFIRPFLPQIYILCGDCQATPSLFEVDYPAVTL